MFQRICVVMISVVLLRSGLHAQVAMPGQEYDWQYQPNCFFLWWDASDPDIFGVDMQAMRNVMEENFHCVMAERVTDTWRPCNENVVIERYDRVNENEQLDIPAIASWIGGQRGINFCPNYRYREPELWSPGVETEVPYITPNDSLYELQWAPIAQEMPYAWKKVQKKFLERKVVGILDTGVMILHPDFWEATEGGIKHNFWVNPGEDLNGDGLFTQEDFNGADDDGNHLVDDIIGWDFVGDDWDPSHPWDDMWYHGTGVAGIVAARTNNVTGVAGFGFNYIQLLPIRAGEFYYLDMEWLVPAFLYAIRNYEQYGVPHILNMSWGSPYYNELLAVLINCAHEHGILMVASSGNSASGSPEYPAFDPLVLDVAAVNSQNEMTWFSNSGTVGAPGDYIYTTTARPDFEHQDMTYEYYGFTGTSAAAPIVSAETALLLAIGRSDPFRIIYATCDPWTASDPGDTVNPQGTRYIEKGIVNIHRAVAYPDFSFEPVDPEDVNP